MVAVWIIGVIIFNACFFLIICSCRYYFWKLNKKKLREMNGDPDAPTVFVEIPLADRSQDPLPVYKITERPVPVAAVEVVPPASASQGGY
ncbi:hypothetical protein HDU97_007356 [Phlyctochytrium planicorne]|nr:hypothetical protein HDU97_007356 [Phlyctochytrium planicorne]